MAPAIEVSDTAKDGPLYKKVAHPLKRTKT